MQELKIKPSIIAGIIILHEKKNAPLKIIAAGLATIGIVLVQL